MSTGYEELPEALRYGTATPAAARWASDVLDDVLRGATTINAMRHPLGFVCIPIERTGGGGVCVHVWSENLPRASPTTSVMHAHSWDLTSYVLYGTVRNEIVGVTDAPWSGTYRVFEIHSGGDIDEIRATPRLVDCEVTAAELSRQGDSYSHDAGVFHTTVVAGEAATVAVGSDHPGTVDLSLGDVRTGTHHVRRQRCSRNETAEAARVVTERLAMILHG